MCQSRTWIEESIKLFSAVACRPTWLASDIWHLGKVPSWGWNMEQDSHTMPCGPYSRDHSQTHSSASKITANCSTLQHFSDHIVTTKIAYSLATLLFLEPSWCSIHIVISSSTFKPQTVIQCMYSLFDVIHNLLKCDSFKIILPNFWAKLGSKCNP